MTSPVHAVAMESHPVTLIAQLQDSESSPSATPEPTEFPSPEPTWAIPVVTPTVEVATPVIEIPVMVTETPKDEPPPTPTSTPTDIPSTAAPSNDIADTLRTIIVAPLSLLTKAPQTEYYKNHEIPARVNALLISTGILFILIGTMLMKWQSISHVLQPQSLKRIKIDYKRI